MSNISIEGGSFGLTGNLQSILEATDIEVGTPAGYELCKLLWEYLPISSKIVEKPVVLALSKPRIITVSAHPKEMLIKAFNDEWSNLNANSLIRDVTFMKRAYGVAAIVYGAESVPTDKPISPWELPYLNLYFNKLDPLNLAGSTVTNQNPNAPDFQQPWQYITAAGQPYHPSRSCVVFANTPIYLSFQSSGFGYTGRSVFQRSLYPIKSYIQSMVTDNLVTFKAGLLVAKMKQSGSIVNRLMQQSASIKRTYLQQGVTGNVLSIDLDEDIEAIDMKNTDTAMTTARDNILANIAAGADCPAQLLKDETFTTGFSEGDNDAMAVATYITGVRNDMESLFAFFDKIVQHRAWNKEFFEAVKNEYPEMYKDVSYEQAFYEWQNSFHTAWTPMVEESPSEKVKTEEVKLKGITEILRTLLPVMDSENRARAIEWAQDNISEMQDMFSTPMQLDIEALMDYEPPEGTIAEEKLPAPPR